MAEPSEAYLSLARALVAAGAALVQAGQLLQKATGATSALPASSALTLPAGFILPFPDDLTVSQAIKEFLLLKARAGKSDRYLQALRVSLRSFSKGRSDKQVRSVVPAELEKWLQANKWAPRTQKGYLTDVSILFNWLIKRGLVSHNPARAVELPTILGKPPRIHTPEQARLALELGRKRDLNVCRALAIRYFAGLRSSEVARLEEKEVCVEQGFIEVTAAKAKTRQRRLVTVEPNLKAWLELGGNLPLHDINNRMRFFSEALKTEHGIEWEHNVTRHSFVSYHLAKYRNASRTALEAGHTEQMTFANYRELVTPAAQQEYWAIVPASG